MTGKPTYEELEQRVKELGKICGENTNASAREHITERKRAEEDRRKSERRYRHLLEGLPDIVWSFSDKRGILVASGRVEKIIGYSPEYLYKNPWLWNQSIHPDDKNDVDKAIACFAAGKDLDVKYRIKDASGNWLWFHDRSIDRRIEGDEVIIEGISTDITERKRAEETLEKSAQLLMDTGEMAKVGGWEIDLSTKELLLTEEIYRIHGLEPGYNLKLEEALDLYAPESRPDVEAVMNKAAETGEPYDLESLFIPRGSKDKIWVRSLGRAVYSGGKIVKLTGIFQNIDKYKRAEEALRQAESNFRRSLDDSPLGVRIVTMKGEIIYANRAILEIYGYYSIDELRTTPIKKRYTPESYAEFQIRKKKRRRGVYDPPEYEINIVKKNGEVRHLQVFRKEILWNGERQFQVIYRDITERKRAEKALKESESRFRNIIESSKDGIIFFDGKTQKILFGNRAMADLLGCSMEDMAGRSISSLHPSEEWANIQQKFQKHVSGEISFSTGIPVVRNDGSVFYADITSSLITLDGRSYFSAFFCDITERKHAEDALRESEACFSTIFHSSPVSMAISKAKGGQYIDVNDAWQKVTGFSREEAIGRTGIKLNLWVNPGDWERLLRRLIKEGTVENFEVQVQHKSGSQIDLLMSGRFIDIAGEQYALILAQNITEQKRLEFLVQQRQKMETLGALVAGVAHEINNPINTIMNNAPLLRSVWKDLLPLVEERAKKEPGRRYGGLTGGFLKENLDQLISDIDMAANRVASIVKGLKDFSRKTSPLEKQQVDINIAVENAIRLAGSTIRKSGITLALDLAPNLPSINANLQNLEQIILNLAINAVQAIDHDHGEIKIATTHNKNQGTIVLSVQDNGKGISPAISDKIFDPFFTEWQSIGGTGLGLPITQNLVKANDGEITFKSRVGKGAAFLVAFTVERKKKSFKILLVDDNEAVLEAIKQALTIERHYMVEQASDGNEALIKIGIYHPDLLILDIFMPQMDGVEVCRAIQKHPELHDLKVIIFTGYPEHEKVKEVAEMGFTKVVDKLLFDLQELMKEVDGMLRI